ATFALEQSRRLGTVFLTAANVAAYSLTTLTTPAGNNLGGLAAGVAGNNFDFVGNLRVDQAWGSAQVSAAPHDASASYYGEPSATTEANGHPGNKWGYAVSGGLRLNAPMIGPGDYFQAMGVYSVGATKYLASTPTGNATDYW